MSKEVELKFPKCSFVLKRLAFLAEFLKMVNCRSTKELARICYTSYQNIKVKLYKDDMFLSEIIRIVEYYNYSFKIRMVTNKPVENNDSTQEYTIKAKTTGEKRLDFLKAALSENNILIMDLVKAGIVARETYHSRFAKDDCPFSYITDIADKMNLKIIIEIS